MQYTAKRTCYSSIDKISNGINYRLLENHVLKEILYSEITKMNIKKDYPPYFILLFSLGALLISTVIFFSNENNFFNIIHAIMWLVFLFYIIKIKQSYTIQIHREPLVAEVFLTNNKIEAESVLAEVECQVIHNYYKIHENF